MKRLVHILVLACLMAACTSPVETRHGTSLPTDDMHPRLAAIDSLMWQQPDSALAVLLDFAGSPLADSLDAFDGHYCQMLVSELFYKNYFEQSNRTKLLRAVDYFDSIVTTAGRDAIHRVSTHDVVFLDARAHYINGVGFYERDSIVEACEEYLKALEVMESHFRDDELDRNMIRFMGLINTRLASLFFYNDAVKQSIETSRKSLLYFENLGHQKSIVNALMLVGRCYGLDNSNDSAFVYFKKAQSVAEKNGFQKSQFNAMVELGPLYYEKGLKDSAFIILHEALSNCMIKDDSLATCMGLGQLFYKEHNYDSAIFYLEQSVKRETFDTETASADLLHDSYLALGDKDKAFHYGEMFKKNMMCYSAKSTKKVEVATLYEKYMQQQQETHQTHMFGRYLRHTMIVIPIAVVVALAIVVVAKRRGRKQMADKEMEYEKALEFERQAHKMQQAALSGRLKQSNETLRELKMQVAKQKEEAASQTEQAATFAEEPICRLIMERVNEGQFKSKVDYEEYKDYALDKNQLLSLREAADRHFGQFTVRLKQAYPKLTNGDLDYCCLYLLGLSDADIAALMQRAYNTVTERSAKLRNAFGVENNISDTLRGLAASFLPS